VVVRVDGKANIFVESLVYEIKNRKVEKRMKNCGRPAAA
jgi:hypothetical protein